MRMETAEEGELRLFGELGEIMFTYFLKAAATPAPQEPFVLQASEEGVSGLGVEREEGGRTDEDAIGWGVKDVADAFGERCHCDRIIRTSNLKLMIGIMYKYSRDESQKLYLGFEVTSCGLEC